MGISKLTTTSLIRGCVSFVSSSCSYVSHASPPSDDALCDHGNVVDHSNSGAVGKDRYKYP